MKMQRVVKALAYVAVCGSWAASSLSYAGEIFEYSVINFPKTAKGCQAEADNLGRVIAQKTGVEIYSTECHTVWRDSYYLKVHYVAEAKLNEVSTDIYDPNVMHNGIYPDLQTCWADLPNQIALFKRATGIEPILHYCSEENSAQTFDVELTIEGFGEPLMWPIGFSENIFGSPNRDVFSLSGEIATNLRKIGVNVYAAALSHETMQSRLTVHYYGLEELPLTLFSPIAFESTALCEAHVPELARIYGFSGQAVISTFCAKKYMSYTNELNILTYGLTKSFGMSVLPVGYNSYNACMAARDKGVTFYRKQNPTSQVIGAICAMRSLASQYYVHVYAK